MTSIHYLCKLFLQCTRLFCSELAEIFREIDYSDFSAAGLTAAPQFLLRSASSAKSRIIRKAKQVKFLGSLRPADIFVVSYPRSGTSWVGFLLANLLKPDPNEEIHPPNKYAPDINDVYPDTLKHWAQLPNPRFFRLHARSDFKFPNVIYILRDPRDVMVSYYHWMKLRTPDFNLSMLEFVSSNTHWPCEWDEHVTEWLLQGHQPSLLVIRYEEMIQDAVGVLRSVVNFAGLTYSDADLKRSVQASQFSEMQKLEHEFRKISGAIESSDELAVRRGTIGSWKDELEAQCLHIIQEKYGDIMKRVGYPLLEETKVKHR